MRLRGLWKLPDWRDWLWVKLGLALMGKAMLSKSLIQSSADGRAVSLPVVCPRPNHGVMVVMATSFKRRLPGLLWSVPLTPWQDTWPTPLLETPRHSQASLARSLVGSLLFSPGSWCGQAFVVPSKSLFPWEFWVLLCDPQAGKSVVSPRTFETVWELLWYDCSPVCGLSARWLYSDTKGDLLQEDLKHTLRLPGLLQPDPLSPWQVTDDPCLHRRHSNTEGQVWLSLLWGVHSIFPSVLLHTSFVCTLWGLRRVWDGKHNYTPPTIFLGLLLCSWMWGIFLVGSNLLLLMVAQQLAVTFVFSQKCGPSTLPSW